MENKEEKKEKKKVTIEDILTKLENIDSLDEEQFLAETMVADKNFFGEHIPKTCYLPGFPENSQAYYHLERKKLYITEKTNEIEVGDMLKYFKTAFPKKGVFERDVLSPLKEHQDIYEEPILQELISLLDNLDNVSPFTFREAFEIKNAPFRAIVFGVINVPSMVEELGSTKIKVEGRPVNLKKYSPSGEFLGFEEKHSIYETYAVDGSKLGVNNELYAVKCWCTSTNKEHWLWIEEQYKDSPLEAIASTARFSNSIIPHIKSIKRQGDIFLLEMKQDVTPKEDDIRPLTADEYFTLLVAES